LKTLTAALGVERGDVVSLVGAGGKTSLLYGLALEAKQAGWRVLATTTTHMGTLPEAVTGPVLVESQGGDDAAVRRALEEAGRATLLGRRIRDDKLAGIAGERVDALRGCADLLLVEADGARQRSLKVPGPHEPVVPGSTTLLVVLAALDVLGAPLDDARVHRVELVAQAANRRRGEVVDEEVVVAALTHLRGYVAHRPPAGRARVFLNKAEGGAAWQAAGRIAPRLVPPYDGVVAGRAAEREAEVLA
jgi:probable selenium-dependent hydroxylase accessory protein YqeC